MGGLQACNVVARGEGKRSSLTMPEENATASGMPSSSASASSKRATVGLNMR
jgi:hypothetical protein